MLGLLTQNSVFIIGQCAKLLGYVMRGLYLGLDKIGFANIGVAIILFTLIIKLLLFPLTVKQQKFSKVSSKMNPEIQAIQKKYKNKKDNESMMQMQAETKAVYEKYGTSPTGSCLQLAIQMPILFSLYYVISGIPAYVPEVKEIYQPISQEISADYDEFNYMEYAYIEYVAKDTNGDKEVDKDDYPKYIVSLVNVNDTFKSKKENKIIDVLAKLQNSSWKDINTVLDNGDKIYDDLASVTDDQWEKMKKESDVVKDEKTFDAFVKKVKEGKKDDISKTYSEQKSKIEKAHKKLNKINSFLGLNLSQSPATLMGFALLIPVLSALSQWLSAFLSTKANSALNTDNPMNSTMKSMNIVMPLISAFFCWSMPTGLGIYWVCSALFQAVQQVILNIYFSKVDIDDIIKKNVEKQKKKNQNKKESFGSKLLAAANENAKNIEAQRANAERNDKLKSRANVNAKDIDRAGTPKPGSMAAKANMVKSFNEKNKK